MTTREFYEAIVNGNPINAEMVEIAKKGLAALDRKSEKAKQARVAKNEADAPLVEAFLATLNKETPVLASEAAKKVGISTPKLVAIAVKLENAEKVVSHDVKVPKVGTRKGYTLA